MRRCPARAKSSFFKMVRTDFGDFARGGFALSERNRSDRPEGFSAAADEGSLKGGPFVFPRLPS